MSTFQKVALFLVRVSLGIMFVYAGAMKFAAGWSAAGYLAGAKAFAPLYVWFSSPGILPAVNFLNKWGLLLIGISLIAGVAVRLSAWCGVVLMALYYLPLGFPYPNPHAWVVDEHIVYIVALLVLAAFRAGRVWGLENWCARLPVCKKFPALRHVLG